jgi:group I intron endonuclease
MEKITGIYKIENVVNGNLYVGSAINIARRWNGHINSLRLGKHKNSHLQSAWKLYGESAFSFTVLENVDEPSRLIEREQYYIDSICPEYNICLTANSHAGVRHRAEAIEKLRITGRNISDETRAKRSASCKLRPPVTDETRAKMREAHKSRHPVTEETRAKLSAAGKNMTEERRANMREAAMRRAPISEETLARMIAAQSHRSPVTQEARDRMSAAQRARAYPSEETRAKLSKANMGHIVTEETRAKMAASVKNRQPISEETRAKMSAAQKARFSGQVVEIVTKPN